MVQSASPLIILRMRETNCTCQIEARIVKQGDVSSCSACSACGGFFLEPEAVLHGCQVKSIPIQV